MPHFGTSSGLVRLGKETQRFVLREPESLTCGTSQGLTLPCLGEIPGLPCMRRNGSMQ